MGRSTRWCPSPSDPTRRRMRVMTMMMMTTSSISFTPYKEEEVNVWHEEELVPPLTWQPTTVTCKRSEAFSKDTCRYFFVIVTTARTTPDKLDTWHLVVKSPILACTQNLILISDWILLFHWISFRPLWRLSFTLKEVQVPTNVSRHPYEVSVLISNAVNSSVRR